MTVSRDHFYVSLPCNSSLNYFPANTITHYTTKLATPIRLDTAEDWEVGLAEFQYPHTWNNINASNNVFHINIPVSDERDSQGVIPMSWQTCIIPVNYYKDVKKLIEKINTEIFKKMEIVIQDNNFRLRYDESTKKVSFDIPEHRVILLTKPLSYMLGYHQDRIAINSSTTTPFQADLHGYYHDMYIYSDVLQYQLVGDASTPLLRAIATEGEEESTIRKSFENVHYFPVSRTTFDSIEIDIRTDTGDPIPFEKGRVDAVLHFQRKK
jgi:hypothetical protein